ncbi:TlpA disulfide reductase family protein [Oceanobacillus halophilus]|uniref:TlpA family protein disulfide reductase n=1 Tax=Oceanobacillus halophilus TaxID=930130 RepID=A0A495AC81_9BACI|nr:TlpA disulfide reductase family protein [Oceanobacillus halophilus]RKQ37576.1 TlpA family protein disulfide reductase [Oceanobacillus halophilus]
MFKKVLGISVMIVLFFILITNIFEQGNTNEISNEIDVTGDTSVEGASISPIESAGIESGELAPDFELETVSGEVAKLSDYRGKKVFLNFWYTYCPPCKEEMPDMQAFYEEYQEEVEIIAVNLTEMENKKQDVYDYIDQFGYTYTIPLDQKGIVSDDYKVVAAPITYFIGTDGVVQQPRKIGPMTYEFMVEMAEELN